MPFDQKRINGPENSFSYKQFIEQDEKAQQIKEFKGKRKDKREIFESRKLGSYLIF